MKSNEWVLPVVAAILILFGLVLMVVSGEDYSHYPTPSMTETTDGN